MMADEEFKLAVYNSGLPSVRQALIKHDTAQPAVEVFGWYWKRSFRGEVVKADFSLGARKPELGEETFGKHRTTAEYIALVAVKAAVRGAEHE